MSRDALWKAVCAEPEDDTVRLAFADWLDENGDAGLAEFVRVQIELARTEPWTERAVDLAVRERQLLHEHEAAWAAGVSQWAAPDSVTFRRGFPYGLYCTARSYAKNAAALAKQTTIQELRLSQLDVTAAKSVAAVKHLGRIRGLHPIESSWIEGAILLASEYLTGLRELSFAGGYAHPVFLFPLEVFRSALALPSLRNLERLSLLIPSYETEGGPEAIECLVGLSLPRLQSLRVDLDDPDRTTVAALLSGPVVTGLPNLRLPANLPWRVLDALCEAPERPSLKSLTFGTDGNADTALADVFRSPLLRYVRALDLHESRGDPNRALVVSPLVERFRYLKLAGLGTFVAEYRGRGATPFRELLELSVHGAREDSVVAFAESQGFEKLRHLDLSATGATPAALDALAASKHLPGLRAVTVSPRFGPGGLDAPPALASLAAKYAGRFTVVVTA